MESSQGLPLGGFTTERQKSWQLDCTTVEVHSGNAMGTHGASNEFRVLLLNMNGEPKITIHERRLNMKDTD